MHHSILSQLSWPFNQKSCWNRKFCFLSMIFDILGYWTYLWLIFRLMSLYQSLQSLFQKFLFSHISYIWTFGGCLWFLFVEIISISLFAAVFTPFLAPIVSAIFAAVFESAFITVFAFVFWLSLQLSVWLSLQFSLQLSLRLSLQLSLQLSLWLSLQLSLWLSLQLSMWLSLRW